MGKLHERNVNAMGCEGWATNTELQRAEDAKRQKALDKMFAKPEFPDEEKIRRDARRKAATRRGSRVSTVLTDTLG